MEGREIEERFEVKIMETDADCQSKWERKMDRA